MMVCLPLSLVFGIIGLFLDRPRWLACVIVLVVIFLLLPAVYGIIARC